MSDAAIRVEGLSKRYRIGTGEARQETLMGAVSSWVTSPARNYRRLARLSNFKDGDEAEDILWALRGISFDIAQGSVVGVIGRNGAGKSTLLKILSRITEPTSGRIVLNGRVSSLLEVGTGFHPELTGRDNVFLNGTVLGMTRAEVSRKFDEIVAFSGVEKFIDTPVKRYSSGMKVRLAFSVAAHLEPEILLIDEVLAVGDVEFQRKCLGKMQEVAGKGRTVLFVSHDLGAISDLCPETLLLEDGQLKVRGETRDVMNAYLSASAQAEGHVDLRTWDFDRRGSGPMRVSKLSTEDEYGAVKSVFSYGEPIICRIGVEAAPRSTAIIGVSIRSEKGALVLHYTNTDDKADVVLPSSGSEVVVNLGKTVLNDGAYVLTVHLADKFRILNDRVGNCLRFLVSSPAEGRIKCNSDIRLRGRWQVVSGRQEFVETGDGRKYQM